MFSEMGGENSVKKFHLGKKFFFWGINPNPKSHKFPPNFFPLRNWFFLTPFGKYLFGDPPPTSFFQNKLPFGIFALTLYLKNFFHLKEKKFFNRNFKNPILKGAPKIKKNISQKEIFKLLKLEGRKRNLGPFFFKNFFILPLI